MISRNEETNASVFGHKTPSGSPGNLFTRRCSQSSKSFAASLCILVSINTVPSLTVPDHDHGFSRETTSDRRRESKREGLEREVR